MNVAHYCIWLPGAVPDTEGWFLTSNECGLCKYTLRSMYASWCSVSVNVMCPCSLLPLAQRGAYLCLLLFASSQNLILLAAPALIVAPAAATAALGTAASALDPSQAGLGLGLGGPISIADSANVWKPCHHKLRSQKCTCLHNHYRPSKLTFRCLAATYLWPVSTLLYLGILMKHSAALHPCAFLRPPCMHQA